MFLLEIKYFTVLYIIIIINIIIIIKKHFFNLKMNIAESVLK